MAPMRSEHLIERLSLHQRPGKSVEDKSVRVTLEPMVDESNDHGIRNKLAVAGIRIGFLPERSSCPQFIAKHGSRRGRFNLKMRIDQFRLRPLTRGGRPQQNNPLFHASPYFRCFARNRAIPPTARSATAA